MAVSTSPPAAAASPSDVPTRDRLLEAAYELLAARGYQATTVQAVARRAGLTTGAIYANFGGKQELMVHAVLAEWYRTERELLNEFLASYASGPTPSSMAGLTDAAETAAGRGAAETAAGRGAAPPVDAFTRLLARHLSTPATAEHRLLTEVTGAIVRDDLEESPLLVSVQMIEDITRSSIVAGKALGKIAADLDTDALVAVNVNLYLGAITSKALGLPQPDYAETLRVLLAGGSGYAPNG
jgi:AcrR family transcriptional regulator